MFTLPVLKEQISFSDHTFSPDLDKSKNLTITKSQFASLVLFSTDNTNDIMIYCLINIKMMCLVLQLRIKIN